MADRKLYDSLSKLGFPMFEPSEELDVNKTLAEAIKSSDARIWEGFPVILANASSNYQFSPDQVKQLLDVGEQQKQLHQLVLLSVSLYSIYHLSFPWLNKFKKELSNKDKQLVKTLRNDLVHNQIARNGENKLDPERIKGLFELYFEQKVEKDKRRKDKYQKYSLEYALSQVFSPKQKELFKKKLDGALLTKTEQEYYSRTVKKKVVALANSDLHSLSRKLLEQ